MEQDHSDQILRDNLCQCILYTLYCIHICIQQGSLLPTPSTFSMVEDAHQRELLRVTLYDPLYKRVGG